MKRPLRRLTAGGIREFPGSLGFGFGRQKISALMIAMANMAVVVMPRTWVYGLSATWVCDLCYERGVFKQWVSSWLVGV